VRFDDGWVAPTIRRVRRHEADTLKATRLAALEDAPFAFGSTYDAEAAMSDVEWAARARSGADGIDRVTFFAVLDDRIVGLIVGFCSDNDRRVVDLVSLWTSPIARRSGAGRMLVGAVVGWARETGASAVELWVTRGNEPAQHLYESAGFFETGDVQPLPSDASKEELHLRLIL
jgi:ribosomal protein S18 acetylase RimI-like enzyme